MLSTMPGKPGDEKSKTGVPRSTLLTELKQQSELHSTHTLGQGVLFSTVDLAL